MRSIVLAAAVLLLTVSIAHSQDSGAKDPDALTCDAPILVGLSKTVGWNICVQNSMLASLGDSGALRAGGPAIHSHADLPLSPSPTGAGDPNAVTCREQEKTTGARGRGPIACAHNEFWARLNAAGCILSPGARRILQSGTSKNLNPLACTHIKGRNGTLPPTFF